MGVFGAVFGCRGDGGFNGCCSGTCSGVVGFKVAMLSRLVREKVRPAWSDGGREREKVRPARSKHPKIGVFTLAGRTYSRKIRWRGYAGRVFRGNATGEAVLGELFAEMSLEGPCWASFFADRYSWDPTGRVVLCRDPASWARPAGSVNPSIRSYTRLAEAGHGRPTRPQQPSPQRKALTKGKRLLVKAVTSLDNGRKWRVYAGRTLELLR